MARYIVFVVAVCLCFGWSSAAAQSDLGLRGVGAELGFVNPEDVDATLGFGVFTDLGTIMPRLMLEAYLDYWSNSQNEFGFETSLRDIALGAKAKYVFEVPNSRIRPFAGGGLGIHFVRGEVTVPDQNLGGVIIPGFTLDDSSTKLGLDLGGGMSVPINPKTDFLTELWFGVVSDVNQVSFKVGAVYKLGM
jgi:opacity protein-like surface antigen